MKKILIIIIAVISLQLPFYAQKKGQARIDSLVQVLQTTNQDTVRVRTMVLLGSDLQKIDKIDTAIALSSSALDLAKKINFTRGEADAYFFIGQAYAAKAKSTDALINYLAAQKLYEQLNRKEELAETYYAMGTIHQRQNYDEAIQFFKKGLETAQQTNNKNLMGKIAYSIAVALIRKSEQQEASIYRDLAIKYYTESGNETGLANCYVV